VACTLGLLRQQPCECLHEFGGDAAYRFDSHVWLNLEASSGPIRRTGAAAPPDCRRDTR
jgi:hypothetical protein